MDVLDQLQRSEFGTNARQIDGFKIIQAQLIWKQNKFKFKEMSKVFDILIIMTGNKHSMERQRKKGKV